MSAQELRALLDGNAARDNGGSPLEELGELLALPSVGLRVTGARLFGDGGDAAGFIDLSDGTELVLRSMREATRPGTLMAEVVATTGARPRLKQPQAMDAVALVRQIARRTRTLGEAEQAIEWGVSFLQLAEMIDVDLFDQHERWGAFSRLAKTDPRARNRESNLSIATASVVLRHLDGSRLVRTSWLEAHVRAIDPRVTPAALGVQMQRVGWERRGQSGRWKATRPGAPGQLNWAFWHVRHGWEDRGEALPEQNAVTAGIKDPHAHTRARALESEPAVTAVVGRTER